MKQFVITIEDDGGVDQADVEGVDMDEAFEAAMDDLGRPLSGRGEGQVTIRIRPA